MKKRKSNMLGGKEAAWKPLLRVYKTVKIPWKFLIAVVLCSFGEKWVNVQLVPYYSKIETGTMVGSFLIGYLVYSVISFTFEYAYDLMNTTGNANMARNVRKHLWGKMLRLPVSYYEKEEPQQLVSRITKDTTFAYGAVTSVIQLISVIYGIVIAILPMIRIFGAKTWIIAVVVPVLFATSWIVGKIQYRLDRMINGVYSKMTNYYSERLPNITFIKINNMEADEYKKGLEVSNEKYKADTLYKVLFALQMPLQSLANYIGLIFVLIASSAMVRAGTITSVEMKELMLYFNIVIQEATLLFSVWMTIKASHGGCEKISEINGCAEEDQGGSEAAEGVQNICFDHVQFGYTPDKLVLNDVCFTIPAGKTTAIVGENGCGKSTITRLLERFDCPESGKILVGGKDLTEINRTDWRRQIGYVFQGNQTVDGTIRENIAYGVTGEYADEDLIKAAEDAQAYSFIREKEQGFETPLQVFDSELSGGQLQRIAIARAFMKKPDYLIMDEATSGVDSLKESEIIEQMEENMRNKTVILISHNMDLVKRADHIVILQDGGVEAEGSFEEVRTCKTLEAMLSEPQKKDEFVEGKE